MNVAFPLSASPDGVDEGDRVAALARLQDLFSTGDLSLERFSELLETVFSAPDLAGLAAAMSTLPALVRLTPTWRRLTEPLILQAADGAGLRLGPGWQLATDTTIRTCFGAAQVDLARASWDSFQINLHLETWGSIDVLVPEGVAVQMLGGSGHINLGPLSAPAAGAPVVRISTSGPAGVIHVHHQKERNHRVITRSRRRRTGDRSSPRR